MPLAILFVDWDFSPGGSFEHLRIGEQESWLEKVAMLIFKEVTDLLEVLIH